MNRKIITTSVLTLVLVASSVLLVGAQGGDSITHNTAWAFQNLGSTTANVHVDIYSTAGGSPVATDDFTVATSDAWWAPDYSPLDPVGTLNGAIVASSDQPLAATVNQVADNSTSGRRGNATYGGFTNDTVAPTMYVPVVMKRLGGMYWTELSIQSTAASGDISVYVHYYDASGTEVTGSPRTYTVPPGSVTRVAQEDETILIDGFMGSAKVEAADGVTPIAVVINEFVGLSGRMYEQYYSYEGFSGGSTRVVVPNVFINGYGGVFNASVSVQNLTGITDNVTWRFYDTTAGNPNPSTEIYSFTAPMPAGEIIYFPDAPYAQTLKDAYNPGDDAWVGTLILESTTQPLVAVVNQLSGSYLAASFQGFNEGSTEIYFPMAYVNAYGFADTSYSIVDMSGTAGDVTVQVDFIADTAACSGCSNWSTTYSFGTNDAQYQPDQLPSSVMSGGVYVGSIKVTVLTGGKTIHGNMNELMGAGTQDNLTSFNAFLKP